MDDISKHVYFGLRLFVAVALLALVANSAAAQPAADRGGGVPESLSVRIARLEARQSIERLQNIFGYYQDRFLFAEAASLFVSKRAVIREDQESWHGRASARHWAEAMRRRYAGNENGPPAGHLRDRPQLQGVIEVSEDGRTAEGRFRTLGHMAVYGASEEWQAGLYDNTYALEGGRWKLKSLRYCTVWHAPYQTGELEAAAKTCAPDSTDRLPGAAAGRVPRSSDAAAELPALEMLARRAQRLGDVAQIERLHYIYGYQQDKMLWSEQVDLFADRSSSAIFQNAEYLEKAGVQRLWYGHWSRMTHDTLMPVDGVLNDHFQAQPVISVADDGRTAQGRFRARDYVFNYAAPLLAAQQSGASVHDEYSVGSEVRAAGLLALLQDVLYENTFVKEDGIWKLKTFNLCIYASAPYDRGYSDRPIPGHMGAGPDERPGQRREIDLEEGRPERGQDLFPSNPTGPDRVLNPSETGCFIAKNQVMSRSAVFPFHYANPVTDDVVRWTNR